MEDILRRLGADPSLANEADLAGRAELRDELELLLAGAGLPGEQRRRAEALIARADRLDAALAAGLRARVAAGAYTPAGLRAELGRYAAGAGPDGRDADDQYDCLDALVGAALSLVAPAGPIGDLPPNMVAYQPTPARWLLALANGGHLGAGDSFFDIGAGMGQPAILAALLSGARAIGVEIEPAYVAVARGCAESLGLTGVSFRAEDALTTDLGAGTLFYLYTPFTGAPLRHMLGRLREQAAARPIRVCAYGPCLAAVAAEPWLAEQARCGPLRVFRSTL